MTLQDEIIKRVRNLTQDQSVELLELLKKWQTGRQRDYQRLQTRVDVDVLIGDRLIQSRTCDISASGVYIQTKGHFEANKSARIVFSIPGHPKPFKLQGSIVRVEEGGLAVRFDNLSPYFKKILDTVIWDPKEPG